MTDPYDLALIVLGVLLAVLAVALLWRRFGRKGPSGPPYIAVGELLTPPERTLAQAIEREFEGEYRLLFNVRLDRLVSPTFDSKKKRRRALEALERRTAPLVLCRAGEFTPLGVVAPSEGGEDLSFPELSAAGVPVLQISSMAPPQEIRAGVERLLQRGDEAKGDEAKPEEGDWEIGTLSNISEEEGGWLAGISTSVPSPSGSVRERAQKAEGGAKGEKREQGSDLLCPECGRTMTKRRMARGPHAGRDLWVCSNFPACRKFAPVLD